MSHRTLFYYDQASNVTCVRDDDLGLTYYTYDLLNRMTSVKNPFGEVTYYEYTPGGQVSKRILGNQTLTYYAYDDVGRVSKVDNRTSDLSVISTFEYEHDKVGNPKRITREDGSATYYAYDKIYQLTGETQVDAQGQVEYAFEYQYDKAHNRTVKVDNGTPTYYAYNAANELLTETTDGQTTYYHYDRCGNTTAKQEASGTTYYHYDTENLLTRIDFADGGHNYFGYDADSKRVSKEDSEGFAEFIYQGPDMLKLLLERDEAGETQAHYTMGDGLESMRGANGDGIASGPSSFYHYSHLGTTHELTDAAQNVTDTYRHDAWGVQLARTDSTVNPHTYVGRERYYRMAEAGLYHLGFRQYAPGLGRLGTMDPLLREGPNEYGRACAELPRELLVRYEAMRRKDWYEALASMKSRSADQAEGCIQVDGVAGCRRTPEGLHRTQGARYLPTAASASHLALVSCTEGWTATRQPFTYAANNPACQVDPHGLVTSEEFLCCVEQFLGEDLRFCIWSLAMALLACGITCAIGTPLGCALCIRVATLVLRSTCGPSVINVIIDLISCAMSGRPSPIGMPPIWPFPPFVPMPLPIRPVPVPRPWGMAGSIRMPAS